jgi:hypothetical protein
MGALDARGKKTLCKDSSVSAMGEGKEETQSSSRAHRVRRKPRDGR